jgi:vacuolar-type H+-ATPase subunit E/Vma4
MSELDKTIEDLEAEVTAELEEGMHDAPKKGAVAPEKGSKVDGDVEDLGAPVVKGDEKSGPDAAKKVKKDATIPTAVKGDEAPQKLKEKAHPDDEDEEEEEQDEMAHPKKKPVNKETYGTKTAAMDALGKLPAAKVKELAADHCGGDRAVKAGYHEALDIDSIDVTDDVNALVEGEDLSEEFTAKATTIFEAAVKSKLRSEIERIEVEKTQEFAEETEKFKSELTEKVDSYLDYVVKEWMQENELAIDRGLKGEIAEDFITGLKALFEEHYIDVPDEKYDILEGQAQKIEDLESKLNETIEKMTEMNKEKSTLVREQVIAKVSTDLAETEKEKFEGLVEDVEFTSEDDFTAKLNTLKENYFPKAVATQTLEEEVETENQEVDVSGAMAAYMSAIQKSKPYGADAFNIVKK